MEHVAECSGSVAGARAVPANVWPLALSTPRCIFRLLLFFMKVLVAEEGVGVT